MSLLISLWNFVSSSVIPEGSKPQKLVTVKFPSCLRLHLLVKLTIMWPDELPLCLLVEHTFIYVHEKMYKNSESNVVVRIKNWKENTHVSPWNKIIYFRGKKKQFSPKADSKHCLCKKEICQYFKGLFAVKNVFTYIKFFCLWRDCWRRNPHKDVLHNIPLIWKDQIFSPTDLVLVLINVISKKCWVLHS